jgi:hypothetical protein
MGEVVEFLQEEDGSGYLTEDNCKKITGVYVNNVAAMVDNGNVYLGTKADDGIDDALLTNLEDMDRFCIMWLGINSPDVLKEDE